MIDPLQVALFGLAAPIDALALALRGLWNVTTQTTVGERTPIFIQFPSLEEVREDAFQLMLVGVI